MQRLPDIFGMPLYRSVSAIFRLLKFHLDNLSDDMDNRGTSTTADIAMNALYFPEKYQTPARVGKMTRE